MLTLSNRRKKMTVEEIKEKQVALVDAWLSKFTSRKLLVWTTSTALMAFGAIGPYDWVMISTLYIGGQSVIDAVAKMKGVR